MKIPQIIYIVLSASNLLWMARIHGTEKEGKHNFWAALIATIITISLLVWGGFFR